MMYNKLQNISVHLKYVDKPQLTKQFLGNIRYEGYDKVKIITLHFRRLVIRVSCFV